MAYLSTIALKQINLAWIISQDALCLRGAAPTEVASPEVCGCVVITVKRSSGHECVDECVSVCVCVCVCQHLLHLRVPRGKYNTDQDNSHKDEWRRECRRDRPKDGKNISCSCARGIATERIFESTFPLVLSLMNGALLELIKQDQRVKFTFRFFFLLLLLLLSLKAKLLRAVFVEGV